ncbi:MAG: hypothetical protein H7A25_22170 [Leptospiraceae bacterium]|nr:hypothetical protein [Leptospiraceae bacterium]
MSLDKPYRKKLKRQFDGFGLAFVLFVLMCLPIFGSIVLCTKDMREGIPNKYEYFLISILVHFSSIWFIVIVISILKACGV